KDINPSNIVVNPETQQLKIIDFGISTSLPRETLTLKHPTVLEGTLAYMSPEQTGRMNRSLDYRTDFYSLGATLYHLLTHQLLFETDDPLEWVHYHIALEPIPPNLINPAIPPTVAAIVLKLLAKTAEERYQSAWGIQADLENCLTQLQQGQIAYFPLAQHDSSEKFHIPEKLYGRESEVATLLTAFQRIVEGSETLEVDGSKNRSAATPATPVELVLVSGYSGIGKSALVQEIYKPITQQQGYFIAGKFDQYQRNIPYFAIAQAFQALIKQLLTESETQLSQWREKILAALGSNSGVITQVIPALERIVGNQPKVPALPPIEAQNRFNQVFQTFIHVFTQPNHPLVIFLDDLQWVDSASLKLIQLLATTAEGHLLLIGAYRDNEVNAAHPLMQMVNDIRQAGRNVNVLSLSALSLADINQLIADTLHCQPSDCLTLAELVQQKTGGNPFFMNEFLKALYLERLLVFNEQVGIWQWSIEQIRQRGITDNVVDLMAEKIQKLSDRTQQILQLSACIGNQFDLETLAFAADLSPPDVAQALRIAIAEGLILPLSLAHKSVELNVPLPANRSAIEYKFVHDRIQQAAYSLIPEANCKAVHWQIGRGWLQKTPEEQRIQKIFDITNQLNLGQDLIQQPSERDELARLNLMAGEKAKASAAYSAALRYFQTGLALLSADCWQQYAFTLKLYIETAEAEYLNINFEQANTLAEIALSHATNLLDRVRVYELQMQICMAQLELVKAIDIGLQVLEQLGIPLTILAAEESLLVDLPALTDLSDLTVMTDPYKLAAMQILKILCTPVFMAKPELLPQIIITMVNLCIEHGNS
ncbi:MAG TPA: AAA family ATPase, partial [Coleofasciculaceae cyanobacterium]